MYGQGIASTALGSLIRKAQEERQNAPHLTPASASESSPIRQQIEGPLVAPESVGSEKMVSIKPEMSQNKEVVMPSQDGQPIQNQIEGGVVAARPDFIPNTTGIINPNTNFNIGSNTPSTTVNKSVPVGSNINQALSLGNKGTLLPSNINVGKPIVDSSKLKGTISAAPSSNTGAKVTSGAAANIAKSVLSGRSILQTVLNLIPSWVQKTSLNTLLKQASSGVSKT